MRSRRRLALLVAVVVAAATTGAACTSSKAGEPVPTTAPTSTAKPGSLTGSHRCAVNGFTCSMLTVSLDRPTADARARVRGALWRYARQP